MHCDQPRAIVHLLFRWPRCSGLESGRCKRQFLHVFKAYDKQYQTRTSVVQGNRTCARESSEGPCLPSAVAFPSLLCQTGCPYVDCAPHGRSHGDLPGRLRLRGDDAPPPGTGGARLRLLEDPQPPPPPPAAPAADTAPLSTGSSRPPDDSTGEPLLLPYTRTTLYYFTDSAPARWIIFKNSYLHSLRAFNPLSVSIRVLCYDDRAHALCHGLTHGDRHVACVNLMAHMPEDFVDRNPNGDTVWNGPKWKLFVDVARRPTPSSGRE